MNASRFAGPRELDFGELLSRSLRNLALIWRQVLVYLFVALLLGLGMPLMGKESTGLVGFLLYFAGQYWLFRSLLKVSGVGPKIALGILSGINVDGFLLCIEAQDADQLVRIPGVGRKTAERLLIEMRDRVKEFGATGAAGVAPVAGEGGSAQQEAYSALVALGYRPAEVVKLLKSVAQEGATTEDLIRRALQSAAG